MSYRHEELEELCGLAAIDQISEQDRVELDAHLLTCVGCRERIAGMERASFEYFLLFASQTKKTSLPLGMADRFSVRALRHGVPLLGRASLVSSGRFAAVLAVACVLLLVVKGTVMFREQQLLQQEDVSIAAARVERNQHAQSVGGTSAEKLKRVSSRGKATHRAKRNIAPTAIRLSAGTVLAFHPHTTLSSQFLSRWEFNAPIEMRPLAAADLANGRDGLRIGMRPLDPASLALPWKQQERTQPSMRSFHFESALATLPLSAPSEGLSVPRLWDVNRVPVNLQSSDNRAW